MQGVQLFRQLFSFFLRHAFFPFGFKDLGLLLQKDYARFDSLGYLAYMVFATANLDYARSANNGVIRALEKLIGFFHTVFQFKKGGRIARPKLVRFAGD